MISFSDFEVQVQQKARINLNIGENREKKRKNKDRKVWFAQKHCHDAGFFFLNYSSKQHR